MGGSAQAWDRRRQGDAGTCEGDHTGLFFDRAKGLAFASTLSDGLTHSQVNSLLMTDLQKGYDLRQQLQTLNRPVLIVQGHQDPVGDKTAEDIHDVIPGSRLRYIARAGHYPWLEEPDEFRRIIAEFLSDWADEPK